jgi:membrane-associated PAP2 superfamily phosphatase
VFIGPLYGLTQQLRGAHFLSHDLVSIALCWFVSYAVFAFAEVCRRH